MNITPTDLWKFGSSAYRVDNAGNVREATEDEIVAETKSSPAAMVKVLGTGADLLRFNANNHYRDQVKIIAELQAQEGKTVEEIAAEVKKATEDLRNAMRVDIKNGVFRVNDSGQVFHNDNPIPPESVGFELNALLIESITDKIGELNVLGSQLATVDSWVQSNLGDKDYAIALYDRQTSWEIQSKVEVSLPSHNKWDGSHRSSTHDSRISDLESWKNNNNHLSDFDKFVQKSFDDYKNTQVNPGQSLIDTMYNDYKSLLKDSGLSTPVWLTDKGNGSSSENSSKKNVDGDNNELKLNSQRVSIPGLARDRNEVYRGTQMLRDANQQAFTATALTEAKENIRSRTSTLSTLSEQLGTNFKVDNSRFNNIIEAMNSYNKSVVDSLRRFSVI